MAQLRGVPVAVNLLTTVFVTKLNRELRSATLIDRAVGGGPVVAGAAFTIAWTPCVGPTLGAVLGHHAAVQLVGGTVLIGMGMLVVSGELCRLSIEAQRLLDDLGLNFFKSV